MSIEVANQSGIVLGQFASNLGYTDLISASKHDDLLAGFFEAGFVQGKGGVAMVASALRKLSGGKDVKTTAKGLADLIDGEKSVFITNGTYGGDEEKEE